MPDDKETILLDILALTDATFWPYNWSESTSPTVVYERRRDFHLRGVTWHPEDTTEASRKRAQRRISELFNSGMVQRFKSRSDRTLSLRLTPEGDVWTRGLVDPGAYDAVPDFLQELLALETHDDAGAEPYAGWIPDVLLTGKAQGAEGWMEALVTESFYWLLQFQLGLAEYNSSRRGHGYYRLTDAGRRIATGQDTFTVPQIAAPEPSDEAGKYYGEALMAARIATRAAKSDSNEIGYIPLPVSLPSRKVTAEYASLPK